MAKIKDEKLVVSAKSVSLPNWMWNVIDKAESRSKFIRDLLEKVPAIKKARRRIEK